MDPLSIKRGDVREANRTVGRREADMSTYSASVSQDCITDFNDLKLSKKHKYIIFKLTDDNKEIVVEEASPEKDWEVFREKLINATSKNKMVRPMGTDGPLGLDGRNRVADWLCDVGQSWQGSALRYL